MKRGKLACVPAGGQVHPLQGGRPRLRQGRHHTHRLTGGARGVVLGVVLGLVLVVILFHDYVDDDVEKDEDENDFDDVNVNDDIKL